VERREPASSFPRQGRVALAPLRSTADTRPWWGNDEGPMYLYSGLSREHHHLVTLKGAESERTLRLAPFT